MVKILPFQATLYNVEKVGELSRVISPPYDRIDPAYRKELYDRHPYNIARVIRGEGESGKADYAAVGELWRRMGREGVTTRFDRPAFYIHWEDFTDPDGKHRLRKGVFAMVGLEEEGGGIRPHERTMTAPKEDRLSLLRATRAHQDPVFALYADPAGEVRTLLEPAGDPLFELTDDQGRRHRLWVLDDELTHAQIRAVMEDREIFIADGHHRYETALAYRREMRRAGRRGTGAESFDHLLMELMPVEDPGLVILPTHRLVRKSEEWNRGRFLEELREKFEVRPIDTPAGFTEKQSVEVLLREMDRKKEEHAFGMALQGDPALYLVSLKREIDVDEEMLDGGSVLRKELDVSVLHEMILAPMLGIGPGELERGEGVEYVRIGSEGLARLRGGEGEGLFLLNPTRVEQVREVAAAGERMPSKSTDFYPKIPAGLVMCRLEMEKDVQSTNA